MSNEIEAAAKANRIEVSPDIMNGEPCIAGTRIPVRTIQAFAPQGVSVIRREFPDLSINQIADALSYSIIAHQAALPDEGLVDALKERLEKFGESEIGSKEYLEAALNLAHAVFDFQPEIIQALRASGAGEPVAWWYEFLSASGGGWIADVQLGAEKPETIGQSEVRNTTPLYAKPAPASPDVVEPLSNPIIPLTHVS